MALRVAAATQESCERPEFSRVLGVISVRPSPRRDNARLNVKASVSPMPSGAFTFSILADDRLGRIAARPRPDLLWQEPTQNSF